MTSLLRICVTTFVVADIDTALAFYTRVLGFVVKADERYGDVRWVEVAPAGSEGRLALARPDDGQVPGGGSISVEAADVRGEHERLSATAGAAVGDLYDAPGVPLLFSLRDPDGNQVTVIEPHA